MADKKNEGKAAKEKGASKGGGKDGGAPGGGAAKAPPKEASAKSKDGGKSGKGKSSSAERSAPSTEAAAPRDPNYAPRLKTHYGKSVTAALTKRFSYKNPMMVPRLQKVVINMGLGAAVQFDHRSEARDHACPQVDRDVQAPREPPHRRDGHAARRAHVGVRRSLDLPQPAARP